MPRVIASGLAMCLLTLKLQACTNNCTKYFSKSWTKPWGGGVPPQDQVRFLHSNQLDKPIHFPFMSAGRLTMEHILAKFEQVIQSNQEFRLSNTVEINMTHVSMPIGGKRSKRTEVNLEKHMEKKRSVVRIRNDDNLCMARALVVAKAKIDNDPCDRQIRDHRWPMQTRLVKVWSDA